MIIARPAEAAIRREYVPGRHMAANALWNLLGQALPVLAGVIAIPIVVHRIGIDRFGVLTIAWAFVGYFSVFDLGVGRAITKLVAERLGSTEEAIPSIVWTGICLMAALGVAAAAGGLVAAPWLVEQVLSVPPALKPETVLTFRILSLAIPAVIVSVALRGVIEAQQRFLAISLVRIVSGLTTFLSPLAVLPFTRNLAWIVAILVAGRVPFLPIYLLMCLRSLPVLRRLTVDTGAVRPLLGFGAWITVGNVVSPLLQYVDRFVIAALASVSAVAYYTTPFDMATKLLVVPISVMGVLFPAFANTLAREPYRARELLLRSEAYLLLILYPIVLAGVALAPDAMALWLGPTFARHSTLVLQVVLVGVLVNSLAPAPFALLQASGRPDITAKLSFIELPCYSLALWVLFSQLGIVGAALAWVLRVVAELVVASVLVGRSLEIPTRSTLRLATALGLAIISLVAPMLTEPLSWRLAELAIGLIVLVLLAGTGPGRPLRLAIRLAAPKRVRGARVE